MSGTSRMPARQLDILSTAMKRFVKCLYITVTRQNIGALAAILSFFAFSSMIPVLLLLIYAASRFLPGTLVETLFIGLLHSFIPDMPDASRVLTQTVIRLTHVKSELRILGLVGLFWTIVGGFVSFQQTLDIIWSIRKKRSFIRQYLIGFTMLGVLLVLTLASGLITELSPAIVELLTRGSGLGWATVAHALAGLLFPLLLFATCYMSYRILPSHTLPALSLLAGAAASTAGIYASRALFVLYARHLGQYQLIYGTLSFIMLLTFWLYIASVIVLFGGAVAISLERARDGKSG